MLKKIGLGILVLSFCFFMGAGSVSATTTYAVNAITETGALTITSAGALGLVAGANPINIGADATIKTTSIATGAAVQTVNIATGAAANVVTIGSANTTASLALLSGTGDVTITSTDDFAFTATDDITINGGSTGSIISLGTSAFAHVINIGVNEVGNTINIGTGGTVNNTVNIATGAIDNTLNIGNVTGATAIRLNYGTGALTATPTPNTTVVQNELSFHVVPIGGGAATEAETFTGLRTTAVVVCSANALTNAVTLNKSAITADTITFTFSADPGASSLSCMIHNI